MFIPDITNPLTLVLLLAGTILLIFLGHELKQSYIVAIPLVSFLALLIIHVVQLMTLTAEYYDQGTTLTWCIVLDFAFIFISFVSYLWIDDLEAKKKNLKTIDDNLQWFWKEI